MTSSPRPVETCRPLDGEAFDSWIAAFRGPLIGLVASWTRDWREAEEVAQDAFAEAWVGRERFSGNAEDLGAAGAWLRGIAFRLHSARGRGRSRLRLVAPGGEGSPLDRPAPEGDTEDPRMDALRVAFAELTPEQQTVLRMHYLERTSTREVAALLGRTEKAVEHLLRRARRALHGLAERELARTGMGDA